MTQKRLRARLGLTCRVEDYPDRGERRDCLDQQWGPFLWNLGFVPVPLFNAQTNVEEYLTALDLDGLVLSGGNDLAGLRGASNTAPERDRFEAAVIAYATEQRLPLLGVCRGMQLLVRQYGGELTPIPDHVATSHPLRTIGSGGVRLPNAEDRSVNSFHGYGVRPEHVGQLLACAAAPDGSIEMVAHASLPQFGIMWHPERGTPQEEDLELLGSIFGSSASVP